MKILLALRHAKSSWNNSQLSDHERPLNKRGKKNAPQVGKLIKTEELTPDLIISSTAERALTTAEAVALACDYENEIKTTRQLYHAASSTYIEVLQTVDNAHERVMVVGHNPGIEDLVEQLTENWERMPTAALAYITLPIDHWSELDEETVGTLQNLWQPREMNDG